MMRQILVLFMVTLFCGLGAAAASDPEPLPADFPVMTAHIYDANAIAPGYVFLAVALNVEGVGHYLMILENDGTPVWYRKVGHDEIYNFGVMPNGLLHYAPFLAAHSYAGGATSSTRFWTRTSTSSRRSVPAMGTWRRGTLSNFSPTDTSC